MQQYSTIMLETLQEIDRLDRLMLTDSEHGATIYAQIQTYFHENLRLLDRPSRSWLVRFVYEGYPGLLDLAALDRALVAIEADETETMVHIQ